MTLYADLTNKELRKLASAKAKAAGLENKNIGQRGTSSECRAYLEFDTWAANWREPTPTRVKATPPPEEDQTLDSFGVAPPFDQLSQKEMRPVADQDQELPAAALVPVNAVKQPLPHQETLLLPAKGPLPHTKPKPKKQKGMMTNGRDSKGVPKFENWFGRVYPVDVTFPAWRSLSKTATDVANICRAKRDRAAALRRKDKTGLPVFDFTVSEAEKSFKITRPTFSKAIKQLMEIGFIEHSTVGGGIIDGKGIKSLYRLSERWKTWEPPARNNANILKARAARNIFPAKRP